MNIFHLTPVFAIAASAALAAEPQDSMVSFVESSVRAWFDAPEVQAAIIASNQAHEGFDEARIIAMDTRWRSEIGQPDTPTINLIVESPVSAMLRQRVEESGGQISEIILMDNLGMNVAMSSITSDFWQGDEEKYSQTYAIGPNSVHVGEIELDESSQTFQAQVSFTINDASGAPIGAATIGLNAESF